MTTSKQSWNTQPKISDLKFVVPTHIRDIRNRVLEFVENDCYQLERDLTASGAHGGGMGIDNTNKQALQRIIQLQNKAKQLGLWALGHPKEIGGGGMPFRDYVYINEVQGRSELAPVALGTHSLQDSLMLHNHASEEIKRTYLSKLVSAEIYPSFAMTEPDVMSSDPTGLQTTGEVVDNGKTWCINGKKWFTSNAQNAAYTCVMVRTEPLSTSPHLSFSIILVPTNTPGYNILRSTHVLGTSGADHSEVLYTNVRVPYSNLIGKRGQGFLIAQERLGPGRIFHCMRWLGQMQRAFDIMCERLVTRKFRNGVLGDAQLMQELVFDSYCDISAHRLMTLAAAEKMDSGSYARVELAACKAWGARALQRVLERAVESQGARGLTEDTPLSSMYRMGKAAYFYDGPTPTHIENLGKLILKEYKQGHSWDFAIGGTRKDVRGNL
jgi:acyl-CoA dehydrogenase